MKIRTPLSIALLVAGTALLLQSPLALAQHVNWSVSMGTPYAQPVYVPQPVYVAPQRVYVAPQPVYVQSYASPVAMVQYQNYYQQPYYVQEYRGHGHGNHGHGHEHGHR